VEEGINASGVRCPGVRSGSEKQNQEAEPKGRRRGCIGLRESWFSTVLERTVRVERFVERISY